MNPIPTQRIAKLKEAIALSFAKISHPAPNNIAPHQCEECAEARETFIQKDWRMLSSDVMEGHFDQLSLLSPEAFQFFLPAFMCFSLDHLDSPTCEFTVYALAFNYTRKTKEETDRQIEWWDSRFSLFEKDQLLVLINFLDLVKDSDDRNYFQDEVQRGKHHIELLVSKY
ncbi:DUF6714 family protein [Nitrospira lenta]|uniref:Uncharacterized protein n=1 Tax=Nitrospira lenta TaxID=1436998 RepID=A0A330L8Q3_9BACT|nr:DUF6714 family protein [Nitrospira lenta]SPP63306.1 hypothetical protein NITLEN_10392 [Nitrospira lenta]